MPVATGAIASLGTILKLGKFGILCHVDGTYVQARCSHFRMLHCRNPTLVLWLVHCITGPADDVCEAPWGITGALRLQRLLDWADAQSAIVMVFYMSQKFRYPGEPVQRSYDAFPTTLHVVAQIPWFKSCMSNICRCLGHQAGSRADRRNTVTSVGFPVTYSLVNKLHNPV